MKAAKENEAVTAEQHARESIRIARTTRELLKKFAAAYLGSAFEDQGKFSNLLTADQLVRHCSVTLRRSVQCSADVFAAGFSGSRSVYHF